MTARKRRISLSPWLLPLGLLLAVSPGASRRAPLGAADRAQEAIDDLVGKLRSGAGALEAVLGQYNRIESSEQLDLFERHRVHAALLVQLRSMEDPALAKAAAAAIGRTEKTAFPSRVLLLKALIGPRFPAERAERIAHLVKAARGKDERLAVWGVRLLADSRWPEGIDALIEVLAGEERAGNFDGFLLHMATGELFRMLGGVATQGGSGKIRESWEKMKRKLPASPSYDLDESAGATVAFFGDRLYPRSVFCIDMSSSMRERATLIRSPRGGETVVGKGGRRAEEGEPKAEIVRRELVRAVEGLRPAFKFNILSYNSTFEAWQGKGRLKLFQAKAEAVKSAADFARALKTASGTNIHDTLSAALEIPEVETIYLLSDGVPTVGGGPAEVENRVAALNYLRGIRVIAYGFTAEGKGSFDEEFMKRLARENWGWYRRLNR